MSPGKISVEALCEICQASPEAGALTLSKRAEHQVVVEAKYAGYIERQSADIRRQQKVESVPIPQTFDFAAVPQLRAEARERLVRVRPENLGQAGRITGITPADLAILMIYLKGPHRVAQT